jgi:transposase
MAPYLSLIDPHAPQRQHDLREVFNGLRWLVRSGSPWCWLPHDLPPSEIVYPQTQRWLKAGCFEAMVRDLRKARVVRFASASLTGPQSPVDLNSRKLKEAQMFA